MLISQPPVSGDRTWNFEVQGSVTFSILGVERTNFTQKEYWYCRTVSTSEKTVQQKSLWCLTKAEVKKTRLVNILCVRGALQWPRTGILWCLKYTRHSGTPVVSFNTCRSIIVSDSKLSFWWITPHFAKNIDSPQGNFSTPKNWKMFCRETNQCHCVH